MSTFKGRMKELENVLVDYFFSDQSETCFFLSHCHSDHMIGLRKLISSLNKKHDHYLYCSPISRLMLLNKYSDICDNVIKELTAPTVITVPDSNVSPSYRVTVTPIPAGHCPGSVMFLFETVNKTILYTGDFRVTKSDMSKFIPLHRNIEVKHIDKLYFDATFLNKKYWHFPQRSEVVSELIPLMRKWIMTDSEHHVMLETSALYGYEYLFVEVARKLKCKIHVRDSVYKLFWNVPEVGAMLTKDCEGTKVHAFCVFDRKCSPCDDKRDLLRIRLSAQWYRSGVDDSRREIWKEMSKQRMLVCYATHCSCSELVGFLNYLHPEKVVPCTSTAGCTEDDRNEYIQEIMSSWPVGKRGKSPDPVEPDLPLERNYKFKVKFPSCGNDVLDELVEFSPERKKRLCDVDATTGGMVDS